MEAALWNALSWGGHGGRSWLLFLFLVAVVHLSSSLDCGDDAWIFAASQSEINGQRTALWP